jgi:hypothetical protein
MHRSDGAFRPRIFRSSITSGPLFHNPSNIYISLPQQSQIYSSVIGRYNDQTLFSTQWKQISCPPLDRQTEKEEKPTGVWSERIYQCPQRPTSPATQKKNFNLTKIIHPKKAIRHLKKEELLHSITVIERENP